MSCAADQALDMAISAGCQVVLGQGSNFQHGECSDLQNMSESLACANVYNRQELGTAFWFVWLKMQG